jgi:predicted ATPase
MEQSEKIFVCREEELQTILDCLQRALQGHGSVLFISGEVGIGKTALLDRIVALAKKEHQELIIARTTCSSNWGISDAYLPFKILFRQIIETDDKPEGKKKKTGSSKETTRILYEFAPDVAGLFFPPATIAVKGVLYFISQLRNQPKDSQSHQLSQEKIFDQCTNALIRLSEKQPILIVIDDVHWADNASLSLLFYLARNIQNSRVMMLVAYRPSHKDPSQLGGPSLDQMVREIIRYGGQLVSLDWDSHSTEGREKIMEFVSTYMSKRYIDHDFHPSFLRLITDKSGGNPLFVEELLNSLQENGTINKTNQKWSLTKDVQTLENIPDKLDAVVQERIAQLTTDLRNILTCASVEGDEFTAEVLARVKNLSEDQTLDLVVSRLERGYHLIDEKGEKILGSERILSLFEFRHKLLRQHLYREMSQAEKRRLHARVGECLEALHGDRATEVAPLLAQHFYLGKDFPKALHYTMLSASNNTKAFAYKDAIRNYLKALEILDSMQEPPNELRLKVLNELGSLFKITGDYSESLNFTNQALELANTLADKASTAWALNNLGDVAKLKGDYEEAEEKYRQCSQLAEELADHNLLIEVSNDLSELYHSMDEDLFIEDNIEGSTAWELSHKHASYVIKHATLPEDAENLRRAHNTLGNLHRIHLDFHTAMKHLNTSLEISRKYKLKPVALNNIGECFRLQGKHNEAVDYYIQYLEWAKQAGDKVAQAIALNNIAIVESERKDFERSIEYFNKSLELSLKFGYVHCAIESLLMKGKLLFEKGNMHEAKELISHALKLNKREIPTDSFAHMLFVAGEMMFSKGEQSNTIWFIEQAIKMQPSAEWIREARVLLERCTQK